MKDLVAWLHAQFDNVQRVANAGVPSGTGHWSAEESGEVRDSEGGSVVCADGGQTQATAEHIALWNPPRVLAYVQSSRRILALYEDACERVRNPTSAESRVAARVAQFELEAVVQLIALPCADRPGYRDEWLPAGANA